MTDGEQDTELESWERTQLKGKWKQEAAQRRAAGLTLREQRRQERMLTVPPAPATATANPQPSTATLAVAPSESSAPPPSAAESYNRVRISILAVVALVLFLIWIRRSGKTAR